MNYKENNKDRFICIHMHDFVITIINASFVALDVLICLQKPTFSLDLLTAVYQRIFLDATKTTLLRT